jgi:hypothetical protein
MHQIFSLGVSSCLAEHCEHSSWPGIVIPLDKRHSAKGVDSNHLAAPGAIYAVVSILPQVLIASEGYAAVRVCKSLHIRAAAWQFHVLASLTSA